MAAFAFASAIAFASKQHTLFDGHNFFIRTKIYIRAQYVPQRRKL